MAPVVTDGDALKRLFTALTEQTFHAELGIANPRLIDYLAELLVRFVRIDAIFRIRDLNGRRLDEVAEMLMEAEARQAKPKREVHRHIGDFTLFWSGLYPEALSRLKAPGHKDHLIDYNHQGKQSYYIASTFDDDPYMHQASVLRQLSHDFEICQFGLKRVRCELDLLPGQSWNAEQN